MNTFRRARKRERDAIHQTSLCEGHQPFSHSSSRSAGLQINTRHLFSPVRFEKGKQEHVFSLRLDSIEHTHCISYQISPSSTDLYFLFPCPIVLSLPSRLTRMHPTNSGFHIRLSWIKLLMNPVADESSAIDKPKAATLYNTG